MNIFLTSVNSNKIDKIKEAFDQLASYTIKHFQNEEKFMDSIQYNDIENHKKIHKDLISKVVAYGEGLKDGKLNKLAISDFLKNWLAFHIAGQDKKYAKWYLDH